MTVIMTDTFATFLFTTEDIKLNLRENVDRLNFKLSIEHHVEHQYF